MNEALLFVTTWMTLEGVMNCEINRERQNLYAFTYMLSLICKIQGIKQRNANRLTDTKNRLVIARRECWGEEHNR